MYSHVFNFTFSQAALPSERMRVISSLFEIPPELGLPESEIYWLKISAKGEVEFYSNDPALTEAISQRLNEAQAKALLVQTAPGIRSGMAFLWRVVSSFLTAPFRRPGVGRS